MNAFKTALAAAAILALPMTAAHAAMTAEQCAAMFKTADTNADGMLGAGEAEKYETAMSTTDMKVAAAGTVTMDEFNKSCMAGTFDTMQ
jgi:hypothetical protein